MQLLAAILIVHRRLALAWQELCILPQPDGPIVPGLRLLLCRMDEVLAAAACMACRSCTCCLQPATQSTISIHLFEAWKFAVVSQAMDNFALLSCIPCMGTLADMPYNIYCTVKKLHHACISEHEFACLDTQTYGCPSRSYGLCCLQHLGGCVAARWLVMTAPSCRVSQDQRQSNDLNAAALLQNSNLRLIKWFWPCDNRSSCARPCLRA
jgi:hypothetical protein